MAHPQGEIVRITSRERVVFPDADYTKGELADYYAEAAPLILPFAAGRPVSLVRCPRGRGGKCFFQKHERGGFGPHVLSVEIEEKGGDIEPYIWFESAAGILECVQMGVIEFHLWGSRVESLEQPDRMVFDLDPDAGMGFAEVVRAAFEVRERLAAKGLECFAMLTGGKGVHVIVPLKAGHSWDAHRTFAKSLAHAMAEAEPERFTAAMSKARRKGKIFIDWLRNARGSTAIAPYAVRARAGAPVAVPLSWDELKDMENARPFSIRDAARLIARADGLYGWGVSSQRLPEG